MDMPPPKMEIPAENNNRSVDQSKVYTMTAEDFDSGKEINRDSLIAAKKAADPEYNPDFDTELAQEIGADGNVVGGNLETISEVITSTEISASNGLVTAMEIHGLDNALLRKIVDTQKKSGGKYPVILKSKTGISYSAMIHVGDEKALVTDLDGKVKQGTDMSGFEISL